MRIRQEVGLSFDDVLLVPQKSSIRSRFNGEIDLSVQLTPHIKLKYPIISAAMDTITTADMAKAMWEFGGLGIIHRFMSDDEHIQQLLQLNGLPGCPKIVGVGLGGFERLERANKAMKLDAVHIDVAYAYTPFMLEFIEEIRKRYKGLDIIVGSVATYEGAMELCKAGADAIRVGVGVGARCNTSIQTGNGVPQITALSEAAKAAREYEFIKPSTQEGCKVSIICDGGVANAGDCVKGLAAGADAIMTGRLLAGTDECPTLKMIVDGKYVKEYRGMSCYALQETIKDRNRISVEGVSRMVDYAGPVSDVLQGIVNNILSGFSYQGVRNIKNLQNSAEFIRMTPAGMRERMPRE